MYEMFINTFCEICHIQKKNIFYYYAIINEIFMYIYS